MVSEFIDWDFDRQVDIVASLIVTTNAGFKSILAGRKIPFKKGANKCKMNKKCLMMKELRNYWFVMLSQAEGLINYCLTAFID